jgi:hypothetical protein
LIDPRKWQAAVLLLARLEDLELEQFREPLQAG